MGAMGLIPRPRHALDQGDQRRGGGSWGTASQIAEVPDRLVNGRALLLYVPLVALAIWAGLLGGLWLVFS